MRSKNLSFRLTALGLAVAMLHLSAVCNLGSTPTSGRSIFTGELTTYGPTKIDGLTAVSGQTLFSGSLIETSDNARSVISLGASLRLELQMSSRVRLSFDDSNMTGALDTGMLRISVPAGMNTNVKTNDALVLADRTQAAIFSVEFENGKTILAVLEGRAELRANGRRQWVEAGQFTDSNNKGQPQSSAKSGFSGNKLAAILLSIGGALAIAAFVFANGKDDDADLPEGCVHILSGMTDPQCF